MGAGLPWFDALALVGVLVLVCVMDTTRGDVDSDLGHQVAVCSCFLAAAAGLYVRQSHEGLVSGMVAIVPWIAAASLRLLCSSIPIAGAASFWRLIIGWALSTAVYRLSMQKLGESQSVRNAFGFVLGHLAILPRVRVDGVGVSEATKWQAAVLALAVGIVVPPAYEKGSRWRVQADQEVRKAHLEQSKAPGGKHMEQSKGPGGKHMKQVPELWAKAPEMLAQSATAKLSEMLGQLSETRETCNSLITECAELHDRRQVLSDYIKGAVPLDHCTADVLAALQDSDEASTEEESVQGDPAPLHSASGALVRKRAARSPARAH